MQWENELLKTQSGNPSQDCILSAFFLCAKITLILHGHNVDFPNKSVLNHIVMQYYPLQPNNQFSLTTTVYLRHVSSLCKLIFKQHRNEWKPMAAMEVTSMDIKDYGLFLDNNLGFIFSKHKNKSGAYLTILMIKNSWKWHLKKRNQLHSISITRGSC